MMRIFIDVYPDQSFTSGLYHGDPAAHAANQEDGTITYMALLERPLLDGAFGRVKKLSGFGLPGVCSSGDWRRWGAICIQTWPGVWFERVDGTMRRSMRGRRTHTPHRIRSRIIRALESGPLTEGILNNRLRPLTPKETKGELIRLIAEGTIVKSLEKNSSNGTPYSLYTSK